jgi:hypothetical protein
MENGSVQANRRCEAPSRSWTPMRWGCLVALLAMAVLVGCRRQTVWSGAEYNTKGNLLRLSSDQPFCGCLDAVNVSNKPIVIRAKVRLVEDKSELVERGRRTIQPQEEIKERFDWAGPDADDVYVLDALTTDGKPLIIRDALRMNGYGWPFTPCDTHVCQRGPLFMDTGALHQR